MVQLTDFLYIFLAWAIITCDTQVSADVLLVNIGQGNHGYKETCISALSQPVKCDRSLTWVEVTETFYDEEIMSTICTMSCKASLDEYLYHVRIACGTGRYIGAGGVSYHGGYNVEQFGEKFNVLCRR